MTGTTSYPLTDAALQCDECCPNCADFAHKLERALAEAEKTIEMGNYYEQGKCEKFKAERDKLQRELAEAKRLHCCYCGGEIIYAVERGSHEDGRVFHGKCQANNTIQLRADLDNRDAQIAQLREVLEKCVEALEICARLPVAHGYPDGPCLDKYDHDDVSEAIALARAELAKGKP